MALAGIGGLIGAGSSPKPVVQPIKFSHQRHMKEEMTCLDCHAKADKSPYATFPTVQQCMLCHEEKKGDDPEEPKVREAAESGNGIPWEQVNRLPGHVYFSHAGHVKFAKMECTECHGKMADMSEPVTTSQIRNLDMTTCMACHDAKGARNECITCHK